MRVDNPVEYAGVRLQLLDSVTKAMQVGARPAAFKAATIAAGCSYWSAFAHSSIARIWRISPAPSVPSQKFA
jgi:hypothetical protein